MKDEIKEILDYLGNNKNYNCDCNDGSYYLELPYREAHELKDCITNLEEKTDRLNNIIKDIKDYVNFLVIINQTINGKFSETQWGQDILGLIGDDNE